MQIIFDEKQQIFHLYNEKISYVIQVEKQRYLKHCYYGNSLCCVSSENVLSSTTGFAQNPLS